MGPQPRPYLLRRGTAAPAGGSFKRRSLKLRRGTKEGKDMEVDCELNELFIELRLFVCIHANQQTQVCQLFCCGQKGLVVISHSTL